MKSEKWCGRGAGRRNGVDAGGDPLDIRHHGRQVTVDHADLVLDIPPPPKSDPVTQPKGCEPRRRSRG